VPHSCVNAAQSKAIQRAYLPLAEKHNLPKPTVRPVPKPLADDVRRSQILAEFDESHARTLILLGDQPIQWFLNHFEPRWKLLSDFQKSEAYGALHDAHLDGRSIQVLALAHPRQIGQLGQSSAKWFEEHNRWMKNGAKAIRV
jgi:hypothetical protein